MGKSEKMETTKIKYYFEDGLSHEFEEMSKIKSIEVNGELVYGKIPTKLEIWEYLVKNGIYEKLGRKSIEEKFNELLSSESY